MPPKKKAAGGRKVLKQKPIADNEEGKEDLGLTPKILASDNEKWITLDMKLLNWRYSQEVRRVKTSTPVFTIKQWIADKHGSITDLKLCLGAFTESNELKDEMMTLEDYGVLGASIEDGAPLPTLQLFYDFKPLKFDDPILLHLSSR